jgi:hypothetical protein
MRGLVAVWLVCFSAAAYAESSFDVPPGYVEQPAPLDPARAEQLARPKSVVRAETTAYLSPEGDSALVRIRFSFLPEEQLSHAALERQDDQLMREMTEMMERDVVRVSATRRFNDDLYIAESVHARGDMQLRQRRLYAVDASGVVHLFAIMCAGPSDRLGLCEQSQQTMTLTVPHQVSLADQDALRRRALGRPARARTMMDTVLPAAVVALTIGLAIWIYQTAKRGQRRRRHR